MMKTHNNFYQQFQRQLTQNCIWEHEYFSALAARDYPLAWLRQWAIQAGKIDEVFVDILQIMTRNSVLSPAAHQAASANVNDELGAGDPSQEHFTLFRHVLTAVGVSEEEYRCTPRLGGTVCLIESLYSAVHSSDSVHALAVMASEELLCPREFPLFLRALSRYVPSEKLNYFDVHIRQDVDHANALLMACYGATGGNLTLLERALRWQEFDLSQNYLFYDFLLKHSLPLNTT